MLSGVKMPLKGEVGGHTLSTVVMEIAFLIMENHGKIMEFFFITVISVGIQRAFLINP